LRTGSTHFLFTAAVATAGSLNSIIANVTAIEALGGAHFRAAFFRARVLW
jgi:hypothetical protein